MRNLTTLPCPICGDDNPEVFANLVECEECGHEGPAQSFGAELYCVAEWAVMDWNSQCVQILSMQGITNA